MMICFFDLASVSGWAAGTEAGVEDFGHFEMPRTGENVGEFLCVAETNIRRIGERYKPDMMAFEAPMLIPGRDNILKIRKLSGLANEVEKVAYRLGMQWYGKPLECWEARVDQVRRHFLGKGYPKTREAAKTATMVRCRDLGWDVANDDQADALAGLSYMHAFVMPDKALEVVPLFNWKPRKAA